MPELPEVETVRRGLEPHVVGRRITAVTVREPRLRWPVPPNLGDWLQGRTVLRCERRSKYLMLWLSPLSDDGAEDCLLVHLGMSGRVWVLPSDTPPIKHDHIDLVLDNNHLLRYHDPRRFGAVLPWQPQQEPTHPLLAKLGPEPFTTAFSGDYLYQATRGKSAAIKTVVMDGHIVVGAGNIYAAESLFRAGIRPQRPAHRLSRKDCERLVGHIKTVLAEACELGGTTLRDFAGANGESGYFQQDLYVYGRAGQPCRVCATPIAAQVLGQRQSNYCPTCQT